jgi:hypothetical protein
MELCLHSLTYLHGVLVKHRTNFVLKRMQSFDLKETGGIVISAASRCEGLVTDCIEVSYSSASTELFTERSG